MRTLLLALFALLLALAPGAATVHAKPKPRTSSYVKKPKKVEIKPLVYDPKKSKPNVVKQRHWWQRR